MDDRMRLERATIEDLLKSPKWPTRVDLCACIGDLEQQLAAAKKEIAAITAEIDFLEGHTLPAVDHEMIRRNLTALPVTRQMDWGRD